MDEFKNLDRDIEGSAKRWKKFVESESPEKEKFPQAGSTEVVHDESSATRPNVIRRQVRISWSGFRTKITVVAIPCNFYELKGQLTPMFKLFSVRSTMTVYYAVPLFQLTLALC